MKKALVYCCKTLLVTTEGPKKIRQQQKASFVLLQTVTNFTPCKSNIAKKRTSLLLHRKISVHEFYLLPLPLRVWLLLFMNSLSQLYLSQQALNLSLHCWMVWNVDSLFDYSSMVWSRQEECCSKKRERTAPLAVSTKEKIFAAKLGPYCCQKFGFAPDLCCYKTDCSSVT